MATRKNTAEEGEMLEFLEDIREFARIAKEKGFFDIPTPEFYQRRRDNIRDRNLTRAFRQFKQMHSPISIPVTNEAYLNQLRYQQGHVSTHPSIKGVLPDKLDKGEPQHLDADLAGVLPYPVTIEFDEAPDEFVIPERPKKLVQDLETLKFQIGYDRKSNSKVVYSPMRFNNTWNSRTKALWYRSIGFSPKRISIVLDIPKDTVKSYMRVFKGYPLVPATKIDWGTGYGTNLEFKSFSSHSPVDAPKKQGLFDTGVYIQPDGHITNTEIEEETDE